jgi:hypothetical protein
MHPLVFPPSEREVLGWFLKSPNYREVFSFQGKPLQRIITEVAYYYKDIFERFKDSRVRVSRTPDEVQEDLRVFGFDFFDFESNKPIRFFSKFRPPTPNPSGFQLDFKPYKAVIWPVRNNDKPRRFIASYIRNSASHIGNDLVNGVVTFQNRVPSYPGPPNFRVSLSAKEYVHLIAWALKYFIEHVLDAPGQQNSSLGRLKTREYAELVSFFQRFLRNLPGMVIQ